MPPKFYQFFISKTYITINNYEMTNAFYMLNHLLTNIYYTAMQT